MQPTYDPSNLSALTEMSSSAEGVNYEELAFLANASYLQRKIFEIWVSLLGFSSFNLNDDLFDVGGDSITAIQIFSAIHEEFAVLLPMEDLFSTECFSVNWLADLVEKHLINLVGPEEYKKLMSNVETLEEDSLSDAT